MPTQTTLIVGAHFRPPAKQLLGHLPTGAKLQLLPQDDNPYDPAAVQVLVDPQQIPSERWEQLDQELLETGNTVEQVMSGGPVQLGFVPAQAGKPLEKARAAQPHLGLLGNVQVRELLGQEQSGQISLTTTLTFAIDGSPMAELSWDHT